MDIAFSEDVQAFRQEVRAFIRTHLPDDIKHCVERGEELSREDHMRWHRKLCQRGWTVPNWPTEYGGLGWSLAQQYVFHDELALNCAPRLPWYGWDMIGPLLIEYGSDWQRQRFLLPIASGEEWWCQGFSEPNAGSDLAALQCKAVRDGEHYVVNGSKIWTTMAHVSDWMFALVRTDSSGKKQQGITLLFIDMHSPGLSHRPIITFDGSHEVDQCYFQDVRVPVENRVGEEGEGWSYAKYLLSVERIGTADVTRSGAMLQRLKTIAANEQAQGKPLIEDHRFADQIASLEIELKALEVTELRYLFETEAGSDLGPESSILKIRGTEIQQRIAELIVDALGYYACPDLRPALWQDANAPAVGPDYAMLASASYFNLRKLSIFSGSNEIQKNIVAKAVLGL